MTEAKIIERSHVVRVEIKEIYDGWIAEYNTDTKEVAIRDFWLTETLSKEAREQMILDIKKSMTL